MFDYLKRKKRHVLEKTLSRHKPLDESNLNTSTLADDFGKTRREEVKQTNHKSIIK
jgi:hypothetical protein